MSTLAFFEGREIPNSEGATNKRFFSKNFPSMSTSTTPISNSTVTPWWVYAEMYNQNHGLEGGGRFFFFFFTYVPARGVETSLTPTSRKKTLTKSATFGEEHSRSSRR